MFSHHPTIKATGANTRLCQPVRQSSVLREPRAMPPAKLPADPTAPLSTPTPAHPPRGADRGSSVWRRGGHPRVVATAQAGEHSFGTVTQPCHAGTAQGHTCAELTPALPEPRDPAGS